MLFGGSGSSVFLGDAAGRLSYMVVYWGKEVRTGTNQRVPTRQSSCWLLR